MAEFIAAREHLAKGDVVIVQCSHQCNVLVMDDKNFDSYRRKQKCTYHGGHFTRFPARIVVPDTGYWNTVIDLGGRQATISHTINYLRQNRKPPVPPRA
jgi:hypothetical protein